MPTTPVSVVYANIEHADHNNQLSGHIKNHDPDVVVLTEAYAARPWLRDHFGHYALFQATKGNQGAEGPDIAVMVHHRNTVVDHDLLHMSEPWWYSSKGTPKKHPPRIFQSVAFDTKTGVRCRILGLHYPPGGPSGGSSHTGGKNKKAWKESADQTVKWANNHSVPIIAVGDYNATTDETKHHVKSRWNGHTDYASLGKVDHLICRGLTVAGKKSFDAPVGHGWGLIHLEV